MSAAATSIDWNGLKNVRADEDGAACETCEAVRAELAKAHQMLAAIARIEPKPARPELSDDPADLMVIGYAQAFAAIRTRIDLFLKRAR